MEHASYKEVKNFIHNEAKITREDIREIIRQCVQDEVRKVVESKDQFFSTTIQNTIRDLVKENILGVKKGYLNHFTFQDAVRREFRDLVGEYVLSLVDVDVKFKEQKQEE